MKIKNKISLFLILCISTLLISSCRKYQIYSDETSTPAESKNNDDENKNTGSISTGGSEETKNNEKPVKEDEVINEEFEALCNEYFINTLGDSAYAWNVLTLDAANFGYEGTKEAIWYSYHTETAEALENTKIALNDFLTELEKFKDASLSTNQRYTYEMLYTQTHNNIEKYKNASLNDLFLDLDYITSDGGYVSEFTQVMQGYRINDISNAREIISYTSSTAEAFPSYLIYAEDKKNSGYPLINYSVQGMIDYLNSITEKGENFYLKELIHNKIDDCDEISDGDATVLKAQFDSAFTNSFLNAVSNLSEGLNSYLNVTDNTGYLGQYGEKGKEQYRRLLADKFGVDVSKVDDEYMQNYKIELEQIIDNYIAIQKDVVREANSNNIISRMEEFLNGKSLVSITDNNQMLSYLRNFAKEITYDLKENREIEISLMDETVQEITHAVAYYTKSPLDVNTTEYITLNPKYTSNDYNETLTTLAHEGYPGHLYSYCLLKEEQMPNISKSILNNVTFGEGWAVYVEYMLYNYIKNNSNDLAVKASCDYLNLQSLIGYSLYNYLDLCVNYYGYNVNQIIDYLNSKHFNSGIAEQFYNTLVEIPCTYASYGYGSYKFINLHIKAKTSGHYDEKEFNYEILSHGWVGLDLLEKITNDYINSHN